MPNQHVTPKNGKWQVKGERNSRATKIFNTKLEAVNYGRKIAINQKSELVIHKANGQIEDKDSYGNDPRSIKDTKF